MPDCKIFVQSPDIVVTNSADVITHHEESLNSNPALQNVDTVRPKRRKTVSFSDSEPKQPKFVARIWPQYLAALTAQISGFALGSSLFWTSTGLPSMGSSGDFGELTKSDRSWIISAPMLGALLVCPITGFCLNTYGRQRTLLWACIPGALSWFLIAYSPNIPIILFGRVIIGGWCGLNGVIGPILISESVEACRRGALMTIFELCIGFGVLFIYIVGSYFSWHIQAITCGMIPIVGFACLYFIPESPYYLMEKKEDEEAMKALCWLRGAPSRELIVDEINEVRQTVRDMEKNQDGVSWREALKDPAVWKPTLLSIVLMTFFQGSYINVVLSATVEIFQSAGSYDEYFSTILIGVIQVLATLVPILASDKYGRRILILISLFMIAIFLTCLGFYFHVRDNYGESYVQDFKWVPLASLVGYTISCSIGIVPLSWVMTAEITPPKAKGLASGLVGIWNRIIGFIVMFTFWDVVETFGQDGTYWFIAAINLFAGVFMFFYLPETKGKTLDEIQLYFAKSK